MTHLFARTDANVLRRGTEEELGLHALNFTMWQNVFNRKFPGEK